MAELEFAHYELKKAILKRFLQLKSKNPSFSLRAYANSLKIHPAALSEFLNDKRTFSSKMAKKILSNMPLSPAEKHTIEHAYGTEESKGPIDRLKIDNEQYQLVSDPTYYSLLCLIETKEFQNNKAWMAARLGVTEVKIRGALKRLERVGLIEKTDCGKLKVKTPTLDTTDNVLNDSLQTRHADNLESAREALLELGVDQRYFTFETLAVDTARLPKVQELIKEFQDKLFKLLDGGEKNEVFEFCFQYFSRTKNVDDANNFGLTKVH